MKIFISYSHKDQDLFSELDLRLRGLDDIFPDIDAWSDIVTRLIGMAKAKGLLWQKPKGWR